jgi:hypothetical protein
MAQRIGKQVASYLILQTPGCRLFPFVTATQGIANFLPESRLPLLGRASKHTHKVMNQTLTRLGQIFQTGVGTFKLNDTVILSPCCRVKPHYKPVTCESDS